MSASYGDVWSKLDSDNRLLLFVRHITRIRESHLQPEIIIITVITNMSVLIVGRKCMLAASRAAPWRVTLSTR